MEKLATFGAGCFWCIEACFSELKGVKKAYPGYAGGHIKNPAYREVCTGRTGHAEVAQVVYDDELISYEELLEVFWFVHDPTQLNRQGNDVGTQYRSVIFYHDDEQKKKAEFTKAKLDDSGVWNNSIVTEIEPINNFYLAEDQHKDYFINNPNQPYCQAVVRPKVEKFKLAFKAIRK